MNSQTRQQGSAKLKLQYFKIQIQVTLPNPKGYYNNNKNASPALILGHLAT
jgi:hypothetical protein